MAVISASSLQIGQYVSFTCRHPTDQNTYDGKIVGIVGYDIAKTVEGDLIPYHREVEKVVTNIQPYSTLTYLIIEYSQSNQSGLKLVRAREWIDESSITVYNPDTSFDIRIYNMSRDNYGQVVLDLLKSNGFVCGYA